MRVMDPEFLGALIDRYSAALVLYARQWCTAPEDVVQEAFLKLVQQREPPLQPAAWLYRVVRNGAISQARATAPAPEARGPRRWPCSCLVHPPRRPDRAGRGPRYHRAGRVAGRTT
jgi:DNA-directed RNA polymerase specialized sigma24 family protein